MNLISYLLSKIRTCPVLHLLPLSFFTEWCLRRVKMLSRHLFYSRLTLSRRNLANKRYNYKEITHRQMNANVQLLHLSASAALHLCCSHLVLSPAAPLFTSATIHLYEMLSANKLFFETHHTDSLLFKYPSQHSLPTC